MSRRAGWAQIGESVAIWGQADPTHSSAEQQGGIASFALFLARSPAARSATPASLGSPASPGSSLAAFSAAPGGPQGCNAPIQLALDRVHPQ